MQSIHELGVGNSRPKKPPKNNGMWKKDKNFEFMKPDACCTLVSDWWKLWKLFTAKADLFQDFMRNELAFNDDTDSVLKRKYYALIKEVSKVKLREKIQPKLLIKTRGDFIAFFSKCKKGDLKFRQLTKCLQVEIFAPFLSWACKAVCKCQTFSKAKNQFQGVFRLVWKTEWCPAEIVFHKNPFAFNWQKDRKVSALTPYSKIIRIIQII